MKFNEFILNDFVQLLPDLKNDEVMFVSLSARKKYLTSEQAKVINLNHAEMFNRMVIRSKDKISKIVHRLSSTGYYTKTGYEYPDNSLVVYFNVNPSSMIKAYEKFSAQVTSLLTDLAFTEGPTPDHTLQSIKKMDVLFMNHLQKSRTSKNFIDIDIDTKDPKVLKTMLNGLKENGAEYIVVHTHGGHHVLVYRNTLKFNYNELVKVCDAMTSEEVIVNSNEMIPLPGTYQGGRLVTFSTK